MLLHVSEEYLAYYIECEYNELAEEDKAVLRKAINEGRGGKGIIFVFAAGNEYGIGETINMEVSCYQYCSYPVLVLECASPVAVIPWNGSNSH